VTARGARVSIEKHQKGENAIFNGGGSSSLGESIQTGITPGQGTYFCLGCGDQLSLRETERLPRCPRCAGTRFRRDSIFAARRDHATITVEVPAPVEARDPAWLEKVRESLPHRGYQLVFQDEGGETRVAPVERGWTRIGRSPTADVFLDDPSVSRRHAMIVAEPGKHPQVLDDRSLNGVIVNGRQVEWGALHDGDELTIGRFRLYLLRP
jgi:DNA-directed RNA polymerase subunit RPC12/RpoP